MLLRFVEARLKNWSKCGSATVSKTIQRQSSYNAKMATYKLGVDEAAAVTAAVIDSNALTPACIDACVSIINESCDLTPPREESGGKRQKLVNFENYLTNRDWELLSDPSAPVACKVHGLAQRMRSIKMLNPSETTCAKAVREHNT